MSADIKLTQSGIDVLACTENILVLGGPGSGKTTIALLKANEVMRSNTLKPAQKILFLSFARATIARVAEQADKLIVTTSINLLEINTYHGFMWNFLKSHGYLMRDGRQIALLPPPEGAARLSTISDDTERLAEKRRLFAEDGLLHFDLFAETASSLLARSNVLCNLISDAYPFIILDEFQDTNQDEWAFIQALGKKSKVFALADAEQRIYEFRGADPKRIGEFINVFKPAVFDFGSENHRSNGTDISIFGNDLLNGSNKGKKYSDVNILTYTPYYGRNQLFPLKTAVISSIQRLIKANISGWSLAVLVPSKALMLQVSDYLSSDSDGLPTLNHDVALDSEAPSLAAVLIASLLEGGLSVGLITQNLLNNLCIHIRGRKGSKLPNQTELELVGALDGFLESGIIKGPKKKKIIQTVDEIATARFNMVLSGNPWDDWLAIRTLLEAADVDVIKQVAYDAKYLRLLHKGAVLRSRLSIW